jgi:hypothetical protein
MSLFAKRFSVALFIIAAIYGLMPTIAINVLGNICIGWCVGNLAYYIFERE